MPGELIRCKEIFPIWQCWSSSALCPSPFSSTAWPLESLSRPAVWQLLSGEPPVGPRVYGWASAMVPSHPFLGEEYPLSSLMLALGGSSCFSFPEIWYLCSQVSRTTIPTDSSVLTFLDQEIVPGRELSSFRNCLSFFPLRDHSLCYLLTTAWKELSCIWFSFTVTMLEKLI